MHAQERGRITPWIALKTYRGLQGTHTKKRKKRLMEKQLLQHIVNFLRFCWGISSGYFIFVLPPTLSPFVVLQSFCPQGTIEYSINNRQKYKKKISALCLFLQSLPQSCKLISSTRTRLQAPWEYVYGIMLHCQCLWQYCALLIIDPVAGVSFSALEIMFTVLMVMIHRQFFKAMNL